MIEVLFIFNIGLVIYQKHVPTNSKVYAYFHN